MLQQPVSSNTFIGRRSELEGLTQRLRAAEQGHGATVLVSGEAGIGKSRLVDEVSGLSKLVLRGHCFEPDGSLPFAPVIDLLRTSFSNLPADAVQALIGPDGADLGRLLPEVSASDRRSPASVIPDSEQDKHRLFQALDNVLSRWTRSGTLLLIIEDLHWSDDTSLEFLTHLARNVRSLPMSMLLTYRPDEVQPGLEAFLASLNRERLASEIALQPLAIDEVDALLRAIFDQPQSIRSDFLREIHDLTEGNAFFIEEIIGSLIASGDIFRTAGRWDRKALRELSIPRSVQHAVVRRMEHLSPEAREVLRIAAVAGQRFSFSVVMEVACITEQSMIRIVRELVAAYLVVEESAERFRFRHALTRQAVYHDLLARERCWMHRSIGETIQQVHADQPELVLADLAYHFHAAGAWEQALTFAPLAGERARDLHAPRAASEHFTHALDAARNLAIEPDIQLYSERGRAYATLGEFDLARTDYETVLETARRTGNRLAEWQSRIDLGGLWLGYDYSNAGTHFDHALLLAQDIGDRMLVARSLVQIGNWQVNTECPEDAERSLKAALGMFEEIDDQYAIAETVDLLGVVADISGNLRVMKQYVLRALDLYRQIDNRRGVVSTLTNITCISGIAVYDVSAVPVAMSMDEISHNLDQAVDLARDIHWRSGEAYALAVLALHHTSRGMYADVFDIAAGAQTIAREIEHGEWLSATLIEEGVRYLDLLDVPRSRLAFERAHGYAVDCGSLLFTRLSIAMLTTACLADGDLDAARPLLAEFEDTLPMQTIGQRWIWFARARLALERGAPETALHIAGRLFSTAAGISEHQEIPRLGHLRGEVLAALARPVEAEQALLSACYGATERGMRPLLWRVHVSLGNLYLEQDRGDDASHQFKMAQDLVDEMAATIADETLRTTYRSRAAELIQAPQPAPVVAQRHLLTAREQDVALLVARGMTNRNIAAALFVGERTVETHVSNVLGKLGFSTRTQIATWALETGVVEPSSRA